MKNVFHKILNFFKKLIRFIGLLFKKLFELLKKLYLKNKYVFIGVVSLIIILIIILIIVFSRNEKKFALNAIYDVYPEDVRKIYQNMVDVSCGGDLHLDVSIDSSEVKVDKMSDNNILDYTFSYLDKNNLLHDKIDKETFNDAVNVLFYTDKDFSQLIKKYSYNGYIYSLAKDGLINRVGSSCKVDKKYVSQLYGYSYNENVLSVDINIGYLKDGVLYDLNDNKLGEYDGDQSKLASLFIGNSYYRYNYYYDDGVYKLKGVEWISRS